MFPWQEILQLVISGTLTVFTETLFWMIMALVGYQYWQMRKTQKRMFGVYSYSLTRQVATAGLYGTLGGLLASFLLTAAGVTLNQLGLSYIWPVAMVLMVINMRFLCFAYAGGLVALSNVLFGWPVVNVPQVLALVAILHITESLLIAVSGRCSSAPLILKRPNGQLVGAFSLQNFWPLPLVLLAAVAVPLGGASPGMIHMPDWWPLLPVGIAPPDGKGWIYMMLPVVAALGYTDMAVSSQPAARRLKSAWHLGLYSMVLLTLALLSVKFPALQVVAALVSPLGHELLIQIDSRQELQGKPIFVPPEKGVMVLETVDRSPGRKAGLRPGDIIYSLGGRPVNSGYELGEALAYAPPRFVVECLRAGKIILRDLQFGDEGRQLGVILVPQGGEPYYVELTTERFGLIDWLKAKIKRR